MRNFSSQEAPNSETGILRVSTAMDEFEHYARRNHGAQIAAIGDALAQKCNLAAHDRFILRQAALVHDIGEVSMNREYISSGAALSSDERHDLQRHPVIGEQEAARLGLSRAAQLLVRWHHEWWNGAGYPDALRNEQIPLAARILRVADSFAALTSKRPYRMALSEDEARQHLIEWAGIEFDPKIVKAFLALENLTEFESFTETGSETDIREPVLTFASNFADC